VRLDGEHGPLTVVDVTSTTRAIAAAAAEYRCGPVNTGEPASGHIAHEQGVVDHRYPAAGRRQLLASSG
jgi:hypothetical protein